MGVKLVQHGVALFVIPVVLCDQTSCTPGSLADACVSAITASGGSSSWVGGAKPPGAYVLYGWEWVDGTLASNLNCGNVGCTLMAVGVMGWGQCPCWCGLQAMMIM
jgi:hypothetical protein